MKERTSISIDAHVRRAAREAARRRGLSFSELVEEALDRHLGEATTRRKFTRHNGFRSGGMNLARDHDELAWLE